MTRRTPAQALADAERVSAQLIAGTQGVLRWEWDSRFSAVLGVVKVPHHAPVLELLGTLFAGTWDHETIKSAPEPVGEIASDWGLNAGQRLYALDPEDDPLLFAAWWPWGGGTTASLRVGCSASEADDPVPELRRWFSLT